MPSTIVKKEYDAKLDSKRRIVLRKPDDAGELFERYLVRHLSNGVIELRPQKMVDVASIPEDTLEMIEASMQNLKQGVASEPVDLDKEYPNL